MRILVADKQSRVRFALRVLLERQPMIEIVGEAIDTEELFNQVQVTRPDLVLLDWDLPSLTADQSLVDLRNAFPDLIVIALSGRPEAQRAALEAGANAFVPKTDAPDRLLAAIKHCRDVSSSRM